MLSKYFRILFLCLTLVGQAEARNAVLPQYNEKLGVKVSPFVLTASGGVSLGSYQAGLLYYGLRHLRNYQLLDLKVVAGTSAGSVNSLISIVEGCGEMATRPQDSLFWKTWIPLGIDQLVIKEQITPTTLLSRDHFNGALEAIRKKWMKGLDRKCDVLLGISATRKSPLIEEVRPGLTVERYSETFVVRIQGQGPGVPPRVENFSDPESTSTLLPFGSDADRNFNLVRDLIYASTAMPLGFAPQAIKHCIRIPGAPQTDCREGNATEDLFFDGGIFDNTPIRLAHRLAKLRLGGSSEYPRVIYGFAAVDNDSFPEKERNRPSQGIFEVLYQMWGDFITTARHREMSLLFDEHPLIRSHILVNRKHLPLSGEHLTDFLGFAETDFRKFDFYMGMYDARYMLKEGVLKQGINTVLNQRPLKLPEQQEADLWEWGPIFCLSQFLEKPAGAALAEVTERCQNYIQSRGESVMNYSALAQVSINLFYSRCRNTTHLDAHVQSLCKKVFETQATPPRVTPRFDPEHWELQTNENEFQYFMRILGDYHFHFKDLGLKPEEAWKGMRELEKKLVTVLDEIADKQPLGQSLLLRSLGYLGIKNVFQQSSLIGLVMRKNTMLLSFSLIFGFGFFLMFLERVFPARKLPHVEGWWSRVVIINLLQAGVVLIGGFTWEHWFQRFSFFQSTEAMGVARSALLGYFVITFVYYFWHRIRHDNSFLWNVMHQIHHSPQRLETITSFYKHPLEIFCNSIIISATLYVFLGLTLEAGAWVTVLTSYAEFLYHMNIKTPHWWGYFFQRPESHRYHHQLGKHYNNFADLPLWDMIFGTYYNPKNEDVPCGFKPEREAKFSQMLLFQDVNLPQPKVDLPFWKFPFRTASILALLLVGLLQPIGYLLGIPALRGLGMAFVASPLPLVFSHFRELETFSSDFNVRVKTAEGGVIEAALTPKTYSLLTGPYNRRNVYGAIAAYGPKLTEGNEPKLVHAVLNYGFCQGPLLKPLGIHEKITSAEVTVINRFSATPLHSVLETQCP